MFRADAASRVGKRGEGRGKEGGRDLRDARLSVDEMEARAREKRVDVEHTRVDP